MTAKPILNPFLRLALAVSLVASAIVVATALSWLGDSAGWLTCCAAVMASAWLGDRLSAWSALALAMVAADYYLVPPFGRFAWTGAAAGCALALSVSAIAGLWIGSRWRPALKLPASASSSRPGMGWRLLAPAATAIGLGAIVLALLVTVPPPVPLVRRLAVSNAGWLVGDYLEPVSGLAPAVRNSGRELLAHYLQYGLAGAFRRRHPVPVAGTEAERIMAELVALRPDMLDQVELPHLPLQTAPLESGFGYCDQMNAMAANVLGGAFEHPQIVALTDPRTGSGHTIGRLWSRREGGWIYFDLWGRVAVFRLDGAGRPVMLDTRDLFPGAIPEATLADIAHMYGFAAAARPLNEYPETFGGYLLLRLRRTVRHRTLDSLAPTTVVAAGESTSRAFLPSSSSPIRSAYMRAQMALLFDAPAAARAQFRRVAAGDASSLLGRAAALFAERLSEPAQPSPPGA